MLSFSKSTIKLIFSDAELGTTTPSSLPRDNLNYEKNSTTKNEDLQRNLLERCTDDVSCHALRNNKVSITTVWILTAKTLENGNIKNSIVIFTSLKIIFSLRLLF